jgi:two-component system chemotaxis sensor kinase CheA
MSDAEEEFFQIFRDEANERLDSMVDSLLALEGGNGGSAAIDSLFRDAHTIKGGAGMLGLDDVRTLAHAVEDVLGSVRDSGEFPPALAEPLLRAADALRSSVAGAGGPVVDLLDELAERRATLTGVAPPSPAPVATAPRAAAAENRTIRVPAEKVDRLLDLVGETVLHRRRLEHSLGTQVEEREEVADELGLGERLLDELKDAAIGMRTLPISTIVGSFPRAVRDLAQAEGKDVELVVRGADTELDRVILESLTEPLVHLLRNAVAHGIETPEGREAARKPATGRIELRAEQQGGLVEIAVSDDGRGVSAETLAEARREGSLADVLTRAGYSTAGDVTDLAGRGVGLDAVRRHVETFGGTLDVRSEPGRGTEVLLLLPLALALLDVLLVQRGGSVYGIPLASVEEGVALEQQLSLEGRSAIELRGRSVYLADLADLVGQPAPPLADRAPALVVSAAGRRVAIACDALLGEEEVVVKPLGLLAGMRGYLGAAILGDGRIALLLDGTELARGRSRASARTVAAPVAPAAPKVLVVEDSFTVRELQRSILEAAGYRVETARHGGEALERLAGEHDVALVLTDLEMPEIDGLALTRAIRADASLASLPVVVVTSLAEEDDVRRGMDAGADAYMAKRSFDQQALLETVERLIGR